MKASMLAIKDTDVTETSITGSTCITAIIMVISVIIGGTGLMIAGVSFITQYHCMIITVVGLADTVQIRAAKGDKVTMRNIDTTFFIIIPSLHTVTGIAGVSAATGLLKKYDVTLMSFGFFYKFCWRIDALVASDSENDDNNDAEDDEETANDHPSYHILLFSQICL